MCDHCVIIVTNGSLFSLETLKIASSQGYNVMGNASLFSLCVNSFDDEVKK